MVIPHGVLDGARRGHRRRRWRVLVEIDGVGSNGQLARVEGDVSPTARFQLLAGGTRLARGNGRHSFARDEGKRSISNAVFDLKYDRRRKTR